MPGMQANGMIMVDPMQNLNPSAAATQIAADAKQMQQSAKKNRKNRKKNKNKTEEENVSEQQHSSGAQQPKIVTLRNPLFQGAGDANRAQQTMPLQQRNQVPLNVNQPASIIKNDNGMFTIRNTALHQALSNGVAQNYRPYSNEMYQPHDIKMDNYSYFSGATSLPPPQPQQHPQPVQIPSNCTSASSPSSSSASDMQRQTMSAPKPSSKAIGSERKNMGNERTGGTIGSERAAHEHKSQQLYSNMNGEMFNSMHLDSKRSSYSSFDGSANFKGGFNSDFIGAAQSNAPNPTTIQSPYYNLNGGFPFNNQSQNDTSLFGSRTLTSLSNSVHCCDDSPPAHDPYGVKPPTEDNPFFNDDSFLHGIHPGQRLNSEVTIHNINDPKFNRKPTPVSIRDGVEITRINGPDGFISNPNLPYGGQRQSVVNTDDLTNSASSEFGDNVFVPNSVNLNELSEQEREIETFKRFNYYYEPPKNKPKVNIDLNNIVLKNTNRPPASTNSSPYMVGEMAASSMSNMPLRDDDLYAETNAFKSNNCDQATINQVHSDNFLHGIIGDGLKTDHN